MTTNLSETVTPKVDVNAIQGLMNTSFGAKVILEDLSAARRSAKTTDLQEYLARLQQKGNKILEPDAIGLFQDLARLGVCTLTDNRHINWNVSMRWVGRAAILGESVGDPIAAPSSDEEEPAQEAPKNESQDGGTTVNEQATAQNNTEQANKPKRERTPDQIKADQERMARVRAARGARGPGRPKGSRNKPHTESTQAAQSQPQAPSNVVSIAAQQDQLMERIARIAVDAAVSAALKVAHGG